MYAIDANYQFGSFSYERMDITKYPTKMKWIKGAVISKFKWQLIWNGKNSKTHTHR